MSMLKKINEVIAAGSWKQFAGKCSHSTDVNTPCNLVCRKIATNKIKKVKTSCTVCKTDMLCCDVAFVAKDDDTFTIKGVDYQGHFCAKCIR